MLDPKIITQNIERTLKRFDIDLAHNDVIAGGFVRDNLLDKEVGDIDLYSPNRARPNVLLEDYHSRRLTLDRIQHCPLFDYVSYSYSSVQIDHKFVDDCTPEAITQMFMISICQCTYSRSRGIYMSPAFQKTISLGIITIDSNIQNWNCEQERSVDYHYKKIKAKFPEYFIEKLPVTHRIIASSPSEERRPVGGGS